MNPPHTVSSPDGSSAKAQSVARFNRYRDLLIRKWWMLACGGLVGLVVGLLLWWWQPTTYLSVGRMIVSIKLAIPEGSVYSEELGNFLGTQAALMQSRAVIERAQARLDSQTQRQPPVPVSLRVSVSPKTSIFVLEASGRHPQQTRAFLQAAMEEYIKFKKEMRTQTSDTTVAGLTEQVLRLEKELRACQEDLVRFQCSNSVVLLQEQGNIAGNYLGAIHQRLAAAKAEEAWLQSLTPEQNLQQLAANTEGSSATPVGISSGLAGTDRAEAFNADYLKTRQELLLLQAQQQEWAEYLKPKHPKMVGLTAEIGRCERLLAILRQDSADRLESRKSSLAKLIEGLEQNVQEWNVKALEISRKSAEYQRLRANEQRVQALYDRLLSTLQTLDTNKEISPESVTLLEPASPPFSDLRKPFRQLITAIAVALAISIGLVMLIDQVDDRLNSYTEVQHWFSEPILVQIPRQRPTSKNGAIPLLSQEDPRLAFAEAYRSLRSSLLYLESQGTRPKTLILTSSIPHEGKSLTSANLAITLAEGGARVLLVDADLRKGALHRLFAQPNPSPGLTEVFVGQCPWQEAVVPTQYPNLSLLARGAAAEGSSGSFVKPLVRDFLKTASAGFDYVLLDTAPILAADDVPSLAPQVDAVLFVLRAEHTPARIACAALNALYSRQARVLGIIFNSVRTSNADYYTYDHYADLCSSVEAKHDSKALVCEQ